MFSSPDEHLAHAGARRLLDEVRDLVAERVDLDDHLDVETVALAQLDDPIEDRLPVLVAREIIVGDEEPVEAVADVPAQQVLDVVGRAPARLAALYIDDGAEGALVRAAAAGVERRVMVGCALQVLRRQERRRRRLDRRQLVHEIVDWLWFAERGVAQYRVEAAFFGLAGEQRTAHVERRFQVRLRLLEHGDAAGDMKSADRDLNARLSKRPCDVERARELVRLHADQPDHAEIVMLPELREDVFDSDSSVGFVERRDVDRDVVAEHVARGRVHRQCVDAGQRVRRDRRSNPLDDVAVGVVMRRLDQYQLETSAFTWRRSKHYMAPGPVYALSLTEL